MIFKNQPANLEQLANLQLTTNQFKAPFFVTPAMNDKPRTLYEILGHFARVNLNLITLMSLPTKSQLGEYSFYIEISGTRDQQEVIFTTLREMTAMYNIHLLGFYAD